MDQPTHDIDLAEFRAHLARRDKRQWEAAANLGVAGTTLSQYLGGRLKAPPGLRARLEKFLGLQPGALKTNTVATPVVPR